MADRLNWTPTPDGWRQGDADYKVKALEECKPARLVSDCKGVVSCQHTLRVGRRQAKGRHRDLEARALAAFPAEVHIVWMIPMKAHQTSRDANEGRVDRADLRGNHLADLAANNGTREPVPVEPSEKWKY
eukprot:5842283-Amphidinium_carterae.2